MNATQILLSPSAEVLQGGGLRAVGEPLQTPDGVEYWTDDYSNLWHLLGPPKRYPCTSADAPPRTPTSGYTATVWQARHGAVYDTPHTSQRG